ncbi:hypothetical protein DV737_g2917, partial [Chaetothyriales sp. CBS 132003]
MWRRTYLLLLFVRIYFALSPSYLHPDEVFQGPEIIAGSVLGYPSRKTWEWTSSAPIRSLFPLWPVYGLPVLLLQWLGPRDSNGDVGPATVYYTLRFVMFMISFVLEDWAIHELVHSPRYRSQAVVLIASSYVTWTFQTHTFSNSVDTLAVLWSLALIERIVGEQVVAGPPDRVNLADVLISSQKRSSIGSSLVLGFLLVFGTFNRLTFPAFVVIPGLRLLPHFWNRPFCLVAVLLSAIFWTWVAVATDTVYYTGPEASESVRALLTHLSKTPIITPLNNLRYNSQTGNLAQHGLHPRYQHLLANLPQLLGPALPALLSTLYPFTLANLKLRLSNPRLISAATSIAILSIAPHQEPRFLLPCVPLLLTCVSLPPSGPLVTAFWTSWIVFNTLLGALMGVYHQGGIIPSVLSLPSLIPPALNATNSNAHNIEVFYWKTYPPPTHLLGSPPPRNCRTDQSLNISMVPLMGVAQSEVVFMLMQHFPTCDPGLVDYISPHPVPTEVFVAAPLSAWRLPFDHDGDDTATKPPRLLDPSDPSFSIHFPDQRAALGMRSLHVWRKHLNLDDLDVGGEGVWRTVQRVWGRRGLAVWKSAD